MIKMKAKLVIDLQSDTMHTLELFPGDPGEMLTSILYTTFVISHAKFLV